MRALTLRKMTFEAIQETVPVLEKKGMELVYEQLPYPDFDTRGLSDDKIGAGARRFVSDDKTVNIKDTTVAVLKYYVKDIVLKEKPEFVVVRGLYRTAVSTKFLDITITATAFVDACCVCGEDAPEMRAGRLLVDDKKKWERL
eukprot:jgi/Tetstr1/443797/TSEL_031785.t1